MALLLQSQGQLAGPSYAAPVTWRRRERKAYDLVVFTTAKFAKGGDGVDSGQRARNREAQSELYGEPLGELFRRLMAAFGLTQAQLAETVGVSAPMLSQLMSAHRVKIGNPAVIHRINALSDLADEVATTGLAAEDVTARLAEIRDVSGVLTHTAAHPAARTTVDARTGSPAADDVVAAIRGLLRAVASGHELETVATSVRAEHPGLAELLRVYGVGRPEAAVEHYQRHEHLF